VNLARRPLAGPASVIILSIVSLCAAAAAGASSPAARPNVILILADDMGYECLGANGGASYETPHLDRLAARGMRFEHCYSQPLCTPSRVALMTGLYNQRNYIRFGLLDPEAVTFAHILKEAGYRTCVAGKWQLGGGADAPRRFGFDEHLLWQLTLRESRYPNPVLEQDGKVLRHANGKYGPDLVAEFIVDFLRRHREDPFLVYWPMILPHWPFEPTPDCPQWDPKSRGVLQGQGDRRHFAAMVRYTDKLVGRVVRALEELGIAERTLVLFTADNGTAAGITSRLGEREVAGGKGLMTDAGTRVPLIACWPGVIPEGRVSRDLVDFSDFLPALVEAAGARLHAGFEPDGRSFLAQLRGERGQPREWVYSWYSRDGGPEGSEFARDRRFKLYRDGRLFDVASDPLEERDLAAAPEAAMAEASTARRRLEEVLERFRGTRRIRGETPEPSLTEAEAVARLEALGGRVFRRDGRIVEVVLNRSRLGDEDLASAGVLADLTDLSLEETQIGDAGVAHLGRLAKLEWLNLYRTRVGDEGLERLSRLPRLKFLPLGETRITDAGLVHLRRLRQLEYLGLRGTRIGDRGLEHVAQLTALKGLHLGETQVSDAGLEHLEPLARLEKLWLERTAITDPAVERLAKLKSLRELHLAGTRLSAEALRALAAALPDCRIEGGR
jgi:arylsulfatase A